MPYNGVIQTDGAMETVSELKMAADILNWFFRT